MLRQKRFRRSAVFGGAAPNNSVIRFLHLKGKDPVIIHQELKDVYGKNALSYVAVWKWTELFKNERTDVHDESCSGWPSVISEELVDAVNELIREDAVFR